MSSQSSNAAVRRSRDARIPQPRAVRRSSHTLWATLRWPDAIHRDQSPQGGSDHFPQACVWRDWRVPRYRLIERKHWWRFTAHLHQRGVTAIRYSQVENAELPRNELRSRNTCMKASCVRVQCTACVRELRQACNLLQRRPSLCSIGTTRRPGRCPKARRPSRPEHPEDAENNVHENPVATALHNLTSHPAISPTTIQMMNSICASSLQTSILQTSISARLSSAGWAQTGIPSSCPPQAFEMAVRPIAGVKCHFVQPTGSRECASTDSTDLFRISIVAIT